jgi:FKBP-type peptidyl-prolyl cis-trans isomerase 2
MKVTNGHNISVHYVGTFTDGTEFDNSHVRGETVSFKVGSGQMLPGFSNAVMGMTVGETKNFTLTPDEAYGPRNESAFKSVPRDAFSPDFEFEVGATIQGNGPTGQFLAKIQEVQETQIVLDMNHPLAGQDLSFEVKVVSLEG